MLALERAVGASRVRAIECIAGGGAHYRISGLENGTKVHGEGSLPLMRGYSQRSSAGEAANGRTIKIPRLNNAQPVGSDGCVRMEGHTPTPCVAVAKLGTQG